MAPRFVHSPLTRPEILRLYLMRRKGRTWKAITKHFDRSEPVCRRAYRDICAEKGTMP